MLCEEPYSVIVEALLNITQQVAERLELALHPLVCVTGELLLTLPTRLLVLDTRVSHMAGTCKTPKTYCILMTSRATSASIVTTTTFAIISSASTAKAAHSLTARRNVGEGSHAVAAKVTGTRPERLGDGAGETVQRPCRHEK